MTAPVYHTAGAKLAYATLVGGTDLTVVKPDDVVEGDLLWLDIYVFAQAVAGTRRIETLPTGFVEDAFTATSASLSAPQAYTAYKIAGASEPASYDVRLANEGDVAVGLVMVRITGFDPDNIVAARSATNSGTTSSLTYTLSSVSATQNNSLRLGFAACRNGTNTTLDWTNFTKTFDNGSSGSRHMMLCGAATVSSGAAGTITAEKIGDETNQRWAGITTIINPLAASGGTPPFVSVTIS